MAGTDVLSRRPSHLVCDHVTQTTKATRGKQMKNSRSLSNTNSNKDRKNNSTNNSTLENTIVVGSSAPRTLPTNRSDTNQHRHHSSNNHNNRNSNSITTKNSTAADMSAARYVRGHISTGAGGETSHGNSGCQHRPARDPVTVTSTSRDRQRHGDSHVEQAPGNAGRRRHSCDVISGTDDADAWKPSRVSIVDASTLPPITGKFKETAFKSDQSSSPRTLSLPPNHPINSADISLPGFSISRMATLGTITHHHQGYSAVHASRTEHSVFTNNIVNYSASIPPKNAPILHSITTINNAVVLSDSSNTPVPVKTFNSSKKPHLANSASKARLTFQKKVLHTMSESDNNILVVPSCLRADASPSGGPLSKQLGVNHHCANDVKSLRQRLTNMKSLPKISPAEQPTLSTRQSISPAERPTFSIRQKISPVEQPTLSIRQSISPAEQPTFSIPQSISPAEQPTFSIPQNISPAEQPTFSIRQNISPAEQPTFSIRQKIEQFRQWHDEQYTEKLKQLKIEEGEFAQTLTSVTKTKAPPDNETIDFAKILEENMTQSRNSDSAFQKGKEKHSNHGFPNGDVDVTTESDNIVRPTSAVTWKTWRDVNESDAYTDVKKYIHDNELMDEEREKWIRTWLTDVTTAMERMGEEGLLVQTE